MSSPPLGCLFFLSPLHSRRAYPVESDPGFPTHGFSPLLLFSIQSIGLCEWFPKIVADRDSVLWRCVVRSVPRQGVSADRETLHFRIKSSFFLKSLYLRLTSTLLLHFTPRETLDRELFGGSSKADSQPFVNNLPLTPCRTEFFLLLP